MNKRVVEVGVLALALVITSLCKYTASESDESIDDTLEARI